MVELDERNLADFYKMYDTGPAEVELSMIRRNRLYRRFMELLRNDDNFTAGLSEGFLKYVMLSSADGVFKPLYLLKKDVIAVLASWYLKRHPEHGHVIFEDLADRI